MKSLTELERLIELSDFHLDYSGQDQCLDDLARLAARICGAKVSLVNLIDRYTQWTVARYGANIKQMPRKDSVCQYVVDQATALEFKELKLDPCFKDKAYISGGPELNYYYGIPLKTQKGAFIGALCVLDTEIEGLSQEQQELLAIVAELVVHRLESAKEKNAQQELLDEAKKSIQKVGHDVRGPISGILGIVEILKVESGEKKLSEVDEMLRLIEDSAESVIELADSILNVDKYSVAKICGQQLAGKIEQLYAPQALSKNIQLSVIHQDESEPIYFAVKGLLQICGNLVNNAIKFTPVGGSVSVKITPEEEQANRSNFLRIEVEDTGVGMSQERIEEILEGRVQSAEGTKGERGHGLGLPLVRELVNKEKGSLDLSSKPGEGCKFTVRLPI